MRKQIDIIQNISPSQEVTHLCTLLVLGTGKVGLVIFTTMKFTKSIKMMIPTPFSLAPYLKKSFLWFQREFFNIHSYSSSLVPVIALVTLVDAGAKSKINRRQV